MGGVGEVNTLGMRCFKDHTLQNTKENRFGVGDMDDAYDKVNLVGSKVGHPAQAFELVKGKSERTSYPQRKRRGFKGCCIDPDWNGRGTSVSPKHN
jgi:hypothetical protein